MAKLGGPGRSVNAPREPDGVPSITAFEWFMAFANCPHRDRDRVRRRLAATLFAALTLLAVRPVTAETIQIHAAEWQGYTNADGSGFGWDVVRAVFDSAGVDIAFETMPYSRSIHTVLHGHADAWIGAYRNEVPEAVYPDWHYDADRVDAIFRADAGITWRGPSTLRGADVVWLHDYRMDKYLDVPVDAEQTLKQTSALKMVARERVDYYIGTAYEFETYFDNGAPSLSRETFDREHLMNLELYVAFAPSDRGRRFARIWDRQFPKLLADATIGAIYARHDFRLWPFDVPRDGAGS